MTDATTVNQAYFNKIAAQYDDIYPDAFRQLEEQIRNNIGFINMKSKGRVLDYACGTGLLSRSLGDHAGVCVGIDISENMVDAYKARAKLEGRSDTEREAYFGNLIDREEIEPRHFLNQPKFFDFDLAGVGLGFHHFDDPELAATRLAARLSRGGVLFILDFLPHDDGHDYRHHGVVHQGFSEQRIRTIFENAGVGAYFAYKELDRTEFTPAGPGHHGSPTSRRLFIARGTKF